MSCCIDHNYWPWTPRYGACEIDAWISVFIAVSTNSLLHDLTLGQCCTLVSCVTVVGIIRNYLLCNSRLLAKRSSYRTNSAKKASKYWSLVWCKEKPSFIFKCPSLPHSTSWVGCFLNIIVFLLLNVFRQHWHHSYDASLLSDLLCGNARSSRLSGTVGGNILSSAAASLCTATCQSHHSCSSFMCKCAICYELQLHFVCVLYDNTFDCSLTLCWQRWFIVQILQVTCSSGDEAAYEWLWLSFGC